MRGNKKINKSKQSIQIYQPHRHYAAYKVVATIISDIQLLLSRYIEQLERQRYLDSNLNKYAYIHHLINFTDFFHSQLITIPATATFTHQKQPKSIAIDSLCRPSLSQLPQKISLLSIKQSRFSQKSTASSLKDSILGKYKSQSVKLKLQPIEQIKSIGQLRQIKIDKQNELIRKREEEQQQRKRLGRAQALKIDISFDYNGQKIYKSTKTRDNLVQKLLDLKLNNQKITRKTQLPPQPQTVDSLRVDKSNQKKSKKSKQKKGKKKGGQSQFTQFLSNQSLGDNVEISRGIRYSHNSLVFSQKKVILQPLELKSRLGKRKLSKPQFMKVSQLVDKSRESRLKKFKTEQRSQHALNSKRAYSQTNFKSSRLRNREVINVINAQLRQSMLIRLADYQSFLVIEKQFAEDRTQQQSNPEVMDEQLSMISVVRREQARSAVSQAVSEMPILAAIQGKRVDGIREQELVITRLGNLLRQKL